MELKKEEFFRIDNYLFLNEENAKKYIKSCDASVDTYIWLSWEDIQKYDSDEELMRGLIEFKGLDEEESIAKLEEMLKAYEEDVDDLLDTFEIDYDFKDYSSSGPRYVLTGSCENLLRFARDYASHYTLDNRGEMLDIFKEEIKVDELSGDDDLIDGEIYD